MPGAMVIIRYAVFAVVAVSIITGFAAMAVQRRTLNPFGRLARFIRTFSDPVVRPIERRVLRAGGNPQQAPWWLIGLSIFVGIALLSAVEWAIGYVQMLAYASTVPGGLAHMILRLIIGLLELALIVRVIGSWFGIGGLVPWMRPFYLLTEWFLAPMRRVIPSFGPIDITPIVAWILLSLIGSRV